MSATPTATTRLIVLLGDPVAHSLSPALQNAAIRAAGLDAVFVPLRCAAADLPALLRGIARAGGAGNVTIPHKALAAAIVDRATAVVERTGACNAFWLEDGVIRGDNTDVAGFRAAAALLRPDLTGAAALVLGAGGAAAAAACGLMDDGVHRITLLNRSTERARALARRLDPDADRIDVAPTQDVLVRRGFDLIVNATSLGLRDEDPLPLDLRSLAPPGAVLDLVYRRAGVTPWVRQARLLGIPADGGTEMLLAQGAAAFERWFGRPASLDAMRAALDA